MRYFDRIVRYLVTHYALVVAHSALVVEHSAIVTFNRVPALRSFVLAYRNGVCGVERGLRRAVLRTGLFT